VSRGMSISGTSRTGRRLPRLRSVARCLPLGPLLLSACSDIVENIPPRPAASDEPAVVAPYPNLAAVPARPELGYTLEQRREIAQGLVADRANARYAGDALREDLGRPVEPDTAPPLPPLPVAEPPPTRDPEADLALAYVEDALARDSDDGSLGDFLDRLERRPPGSPEAPPAAAATAPEAVDRGPADQPPAEPEPAEAAVVPETTAAPEPERAATESPPEQTPGQAPGGAPDRAEAAVSLPVARAVPARSRVGQPAEAGPVTGDAEPPLPETATEVATDDRREPSAATVADTDTDADADADADTDVSPGPTPAALPTTAVGDDAAPAAAEPLRLPLAVLFDPNQVELAEESRTQLEQVARELRGNGVTVVVSGGGGRAGLAMERARRVAALLASGGVPPARIAIEMGGERDAVVVYEADA